MYYLDEDINITFDYTPSGNGYYIYKIKRQIPHGGTPSYEDIYEGRIFMYDGKQATVNINSIIENYKADYSWLSELIDETDSSSLGKYFDHYIITLYQNNGTTVIESKAIDIQLMYRYANKAIDYSIDLDNIAMNLLDGMVPHIPYVDTDKFSFDFTYWPNNYYYSAFNNIEVMAEGLDYFPEDLNLEMNPLQLNNGRLTLASMFTGTTPMQPRYQFSTDEVPSKGGKLKLYTVMYDGAPHSCEYIQLEQYVKIIGEDVMPMRTLYNRYDDMNFPHFLFVYDDDPNRLFLTSDGEWEGTPTYDQSFGLVDYEEISGIVYYYKATADFLLEVGEAANMWDATQKAEYMVDLLVDSTNKGRYDFLMETVSKYQDIENDYYVNYYNAEEGVIDTVTLYGNDETLAIVDKCPARFYLKWINRKGGIEIQPFECKNVYSENNTVSYITNSTLHKRPVYMDLKKTWELNSRWLNEYDYIMHESLLVSPYVVLYDTQNDLVHNVIVETTDYTEKTRKNEKKLFNFSVTVTEDKNQNIVY